MDRGVLKQQINIIICHITLIIFALSGILNKDGSINNVESIKRLAEVSLAYAKAGMKVTTTFFQIMLSTKLIGDGWMTHNI